MKRVLAFDFGASSGRAIIGKFDGKKVEIEEVHRFENEPVTLNGTLYWDLPRQMYNIKQGIVKAKLAGGFDCIGIDTWGVDYGLLDKRGDLLENPIHYRDLRTEGMLDEAFKIIPKDDFYKLTGIQFMELNTIFQLLSMKINRPEVLERTDKILFMPDLFAYFLSGVKSTEYSIASTAQMLDIKTGDWSDEVIEKFGLRKDLFTPIVKPGTIIGELSDAICEECSVDKVPIIAVPEHDTQSAMVAVPTTEKDFAYISCGTWSLFGTELDEANAGKTAYELNMTNEGGFDNKISFLKNIIGLWLIQESRRQWKREGKDYSYADLEKMALAVEPFKCFIDPDAPEFSPVGNIPKRVQEFCKKTGQYVPQTVGEIMRCIYESLAMKYKNTFEKLKNCTGKDYPVIHVIGGGTKDGLLCSMTANACNIPVKAGPIEATVLGNILVQLIAMGEIKDLDEARKVLIESEKPKAYEPKDTQSWEAAYQDKFIKIL